MGERGPKPQPTHLKLLKGVPESEINRDEPIPSEGDIIRPRGMTSGAKKVWEELAPDLIDKGCLTFWDTAAFEAFCEAVAQYRKCRTLLYASQSEYGPFVERGAAGGVIKSPYHQMMRDCVEVIVKLSTRFGLTPGDRAALEIKPNHKDGPKMGAERLLS